MFTPKYDPFPTSEMFCIVAPVVGHGQYSRLGRMANGTQFQRIATLPIEYPWLASSLR